MKILLDVHGGDHSPSEIIDGAISALKDDRCLKLVIVGDGILIKNRLIEFKADLSRVEIVNATEVVTNDDIVSEVINSKKDSSMVRGLELTAKRDDILGMISAGSTGAMLTGATNIIGMINNVQRAALAPILPNINGGRFCIVDGGACTVSTAFHLSQFALMGSVYMQTLYNLDAPRVALVSNGTEDTKGSPLTKEAFALLKNLPINFVGNMECNDALLGDYEVLVCDGFTGNVLLKSLEGARGAFLTLLKNALMSNLRSKIGGKLIKPAVKKMLGTLGMDTLGAGAFLGFRKLVAKAHGNSKAKQIRAALLQVAKMGELVPRLEKLFL